MPAIERTHFVIAIPDLERSADYYSRILDFEVVEIGDPGWRIFRRDNCRIMAGECPEALPPSELGDHSYFAYFVLDDVGAYHALITERGGKPASLPADKPSGMREFPLTTVDGHRIMFGQEI